jgi:large subunit ribosomal protein L35
VKWREKEVPKIKTSSSAKKRFGLTGRGKVKRRRAGKSHILTKKHPKRKRRLRQSTVARKRDAKRIKRLIVR